MKILLVCSAGMSTSLLVDRMILAAKEENVDVMIEARPIAETLMYGQDADVILLGPQVRFQEEHIRSLFHGQKPIAVIDMKDYGMINGKKVLKEAMAMMPHDVQ